MGTDEQHGNSIVGGKYELVEVAGEGGMATVWRAFMHGAAGFSRPVAVKKIKFEYRQVKHYIDMFVEEARVNCVTAANRNDCAYLGEVTIVSNSGNVILDFAKYTAASAST